VEQVSNGGHDQLYRRYIESQAWRASDARLSELRASEYRCRLCDENTGLEVHHRTYRRFGCELASDLTTLCAPCHRGVTEMLRRRKYEILVPRSADVPSAMCSGELVDPTRRDK
jgi:5-methylcytosine-specific restriction endonuclease McrA